MRAGQTTGQPTGSMNLDQARSIAVEAAVAAGALVRKGLTGPLRARAKDASGDLVTDLDMAAEALIVDRLRAAYPRHRIRTEEAGLLDAADRRWSWLVDPLDGTNNVAIGLHACAVGIALCRDGVPVLGVVHDPIVGHTWSAVRGQGATGPAGPLVTAPSRTGTGGRVLAWVQGYDVRRDDGIARALRHGLEDDSRRLIQLWAPLLCWTMLARGDIDGFVGYRAGFIDLPAGSLIAQEAGITICDFDGLPVDEQVDPPSSAGLDFVASRPDTVPILLAAVRSAIEITDGVVR